jgi:DTW domain-containing protein YfiP
VHIATAETLTLLGGSWQVTRQMHGNDPYLDRLETDLQFVPTRHSHVSILTSI